MKKILIITPGKLPVPALKGGAVETLIEMLISENEKNPAFELDVLTIWDNQMRNITYRYCNLITVKSSFLVNIFDKIYFLYWERIKNDWRALFHKSHFRDIQFKKQIKNNLRKTAYEWIIIENNMSLLKCVYNALGKERFSLICDYHMHSGIVENPEMIKYLSECHRIITVSDFVRNTMVKKVSSFTESKFSVLLNTVDALLFNTESIMSLRKIARKKYNIDENNIVFLYSGRLSIEKGVKELIIAFEKLNCDSATLIIAGGSNSGEGSTTRYERELKKYCSQKKLNVMFLGYIKNADMKHVYALGDVLVIPSLAEEAGSLTAIEGMQCGIKMIVSELGALPEYLGNYPTYVKPGINFIQELSDAMRQCILDDDLKRRLHHSEASGSSWYFAEFRRLFE